MTAHPLHPEDLAKVTAPLSRASTLPPAWYTDPGIFELEKNRIFAREWICVGRVDQIRKPGDFVCVDLVDQPLVIVRLTDGSIHAMSSVCLHRAMPVCSGEGNATSFRCPYHQWKYSLDGRLISAPMMQGVENFDPGTCRLPEVAVETWLGFIFVNLAADPEPLSPRLARLESMVVDYEVDQLVVAATTEFDSPWNWKLLVENFMEAYHHIGPHRDTLQPVYPAKDSYTVAADDHFWSALHMPGIDVDDTGQGLPYFAHINDIQKHHLMACVVSPTLLFAISGSSIYWYQIAPCAHDRMNLKIHVLLRPETLADDRCASLVQEAAEVAKVVHLEDIAVNEGPFRGLHAPLAKAGRLSLLEESIWHLNQYWAERMTT